jgi:hypothetical protein
VKNRSVFTPGFLRPLPLSVILKVPYILQIIAAVGLTGWLSLRNGQVAIQQLALELREEIASRVCHHIEDQLHTAHEINETNLAAIDVGLLALDDFATMGAFFWHQMQIYPVGYINFANPQGEFIGVERTEANQLLINETVAPALDIMTVYETDPQGQRTTAKPESAPQPVTDEGWYADAVQAEHAVWSDIYQWADQPDVLSISSSYPIYDSNQQLLGVIGVDLIVSHINQFLRALNSSHEGEHFYHGNQWAAGGYVFPDPILSSERWQSSAATSYSEPRSFSSSHGSSATGADAVDRCLFPTPVTDLYLRGHPSLR